MNKIELSGKLKWGSWGSWSTIKLEQPNGIDFDLLSRLKEISESDNVKEVQISYYLSNHVVTKNEMIEGWLRTISGDIEAELEANGYAYSSWTSGTDYDTTLKIGEHDLFKELGSHIGKYIILEINYK